MKTPQPSHACSKLALPHVWTFTTYFTEGFPFSLIRNVSSVFFRDAGMSLEGIGLTSLFGLPWVIKFLWAHLVDSHATKRQWLLATQAVLVVLLGGVAWLAGSPKLLPFLIMLLFVASIVAATHDIAIDGYYLEALDHAQQANLVGYRAMAYRIALMSGTGVIVTCGTKWWNWPAAFWVAAGIMAVFLFFHLRFLPYHQETPSKTSPSARHIGRMIIIVSTCVLLLWIAVPLSTDFLPLEKMASWVSMLNLPRLAGGFLLLSLVLAGLFRNSIGKWLARHGDSPFGQAMLSYMDHPRIGATMTFIMLVKTGDYMLSIMVAPFMVDLGIKSHYGWISAGVGLPFSIAGAMLGGHLIARYSLRRMALPLLLLQNLTILAYMGLALALEPYLPGGTAIQSGVGNAGLAAVVMVHGFEQFGGGLGTAVLMVFLMRLCKPQHKAAHYAIGSGLMSVGNLYFGAASGFLAKWLGYGYFFGASFLCSLPGMLPLLWIPLEDPPPCQPESTSNDT